MKSHRLEKNAERSGIGTEWLRGLEGQERSDHEAYLRNCKSLFDQLRAMLQTRYDEKSRSKVIDYDSPSWSHRQAHMNGYLEAMAEIAQLLP